MPTAGRKIGKRGRLATLALQAPAGGVEPVQASGHRCNLDLLVDHHAGAAGNPEDERLAVRQGAVHIAFRADEFHGADAHAGSETLAAVRVTGEGNVLRSDSDCRKPRLPDERRRSRPGSIAGIEIEKVHRR